MNTMKKLRQLLNSGKITKQQFRTYKGQAIHGDEIGCITGLKRKRLITEEEAEMLIENYQLAYTD